jgi:hypothetical protein
VNEVCVACGGEVLPADGRPVHDLGQPWHGACRQAMLRDEARRRADRLLASYPPDVVRVFAGLAPA